MEATGLYLLKSAACLTGFALTYILFLRNENYFRLNRFFLTGGILVSALLPLFTFRYSVYLPVPAVSVSDIEAVKQVAADPGRELSYLPFLLMLLYFSGVTVVAFRILRQCRALIRSFHSSTIESYPPAKLIRSTLPAPSFSFFSYVFVNPSVNATEAREILNHEMVHIRERHWIDLILAEGLRILQWFNPVVWIYVKLVKQNHEYLADKGALQLTSDPAVYRAVLLNQIVGSPVVSLSNSFNYSLNKKRFVMMKKTDTSPYRKLRLLLILPVVAILLYSFSEPDYRYLMPAGSNSDSFSGTASQENTIKGRIVKQDGKPLPGTTVMIMGTSVGALSDMNGGFTLSSGSAKADIVVTYVGYKSKVIKAVIGKEMTIKMEADTISYLPGSGALLPPPPPPPPPADGSVQIRNSNGVEPVYMLDGKKISGAEMKAINPETIASMNVLKGEKAIAKYGDEGKDGVIEISSKPAVPNMDAVVVTGYKTEEKPSGQEMVVVEALPEFPGGRDALAAWIAANITYPADAVKKGITGKVNVSFLVTSAGKIKNVKVIKSVDPALDAEAVRVIGRMPDWKPASQAGHNVDTQIVVPVEFRLK